MALSAGGENVVVVASQTAAGTPLSLSLLLVVVMTTVVGGQTCTLGDFQNVQPQRSFTADQVKGYWYASRVYTFGNSVEDYLSYTAYLDRKDQGFQLTISSRTVTDTNCASVELQVFDTSFPNVFSSSADSAAPFTLVVAAADDGVQMAVAYICLGRLSALTDTCNPFVLLVVDRRVRSSAAVTWAASLTQTLPCANDRAEDVYLKENYDCKLESGSNRCLYTYAVMLVTSILGIVTIFA